jgi:FtsP/CotA-like multicopper oxidase with cupredoxin domain
MEVGSPGGMDRRSFFGVGAAGALICTIGGERVVLRSPGDAAQADAAARRIKRPKAVAAQAGGAAQQQFPTPQPAPGGRVREHWIQATSVLWDIVPKHRDEWHDKKVSGKTKFRALVYQEMSPGFAGALTPPRIPGPTLRAEVGDLLVVHFRNADDRFEQALTMHPHGVRYNPDYDGTYLGDFTRAGGFVGPGEEFTYRWEATPDAVGAWPYHDHGPNHVLNTFRGLFGGIVIYPKGAKAPDVERLMFLHAMAPPATGLDRQFQAINGRAYAGNTPTVQAKVGQDVAFHVFGMDSNFHTFHVHGHRWKDPSGQFVDSPTVGPNETVTARFIEDNPGRWLYHCHVFSHQDGMAGWYDVAP